MSSERSTFFEHVNECAEFDETPYVVRTDLSSNFLERWIRESCSSWSAKASYDLAEFLLAGLPFLLHQLSESFDNQYTQRRDVVFVGGSKDVDMEHQICDWDWEISCLAGVVDMAYHSMDCFRVVVLIIEAYLIAWSNLTIRSALLSWVESLFPTYWEVTIECSEEPIRLLSKDLLVAIDSFAVSQFDLNIGKRLVVKQINGRASWLGAWRRTLYTYIRHVNR